MRPEEKFANDVINYALTKTEHLKFEDYHKYFRELEACAKSEADESNTWVEMTQ